MEMTRTALVIAGNQQFRARLAQVLSVLRLQAHSGDAAAALCPQAKGRTFKPHLHGALLRAELITVKATAGHNDGPRIYFFAGVL